MTIRVTEDDVRFPYSTALSNPISHAVRRATGRMWYVFDGTTIRRMSEPLNPIALPREVARWWREYKDQNSTTIRSIEFELDIR